MKKTYNQVYQFKIALNRISPQIWRRIQVPETYTFWDLHVAIQAVMDWEGYHLHEFSVPNPKTRTVDAIGFPDDEFGREVLEGWKTKISPYFSMTNKWAEYTYDFGDDWVHSIVLEKILPRDPQKDYPCCTGGKRNSPPEDVGGVSGFKEFVTIMKNPRHKEHKAMADWCGEEFDPEAFSCEDVIFLSPNKLLKLALEDPFS